MHSSAGAGQRAASTLRARAARVCTGAEQAEQSAGERYLQAFEQALARLSVTVDEAAGREGSWLARVRAGLVALLGFFDDEPAWGALLVHEAPVPGAVVALRREQRVLGVLTGLLDGGAPLAVGEPLPSAELASELVVGGVFAVIRARVLKQREGEPLVELAPSLMAFIALSYLGQAAAQTELVGMSAPAQETPLDTAELRGLRLPVRPTHRTMLVLRAIAAAPCSSNRQIAQIAGLSDEGQTSKLLWRLSERGVIENLGHGIEWGEPNAWRLDARRRARAAADRRCGLRGFTATRSRGGVMVSQKRRPIASYIGPPVADRQPTSVELNSTLAHVRQAHKPRVTTREVRVAVTKAAHVFKCSPGIGPPVADRQPTSVELNSTLAHVRQAHKPRVTTREFRVAVTKTAHVFKCFSAAGTSPGPGGSSSVLRGFGLLEDAVSPRDGRDGPLQRLVAVEADRRCRSVPLATANGFRSSTPSSVEGSSIPDSSANSLSCLRL